MECALGVAVKTFLAETAQKVWNKKPGRFLAETPK